MERKDREGTNRTEALLQAFRQRMGDGYQIEPSEGDRKDVIFKIIKDGEQEGISACWTRDVWQIWEPMRNY